MGKAWVRTITLLSALGFLLAWTELPSPCAAQGYCYQAPPVPVYTYPNYYGYVQPGSVPAGYYVAAPSPWHCKPKHWRKHKHHRYKCGYYGCY